MWQKERSGFQVVFVEAVYRNGRVFLEFAAKTTHFHAKQIACFGYTLVIVRYIEHGTFCCIFKVKWQYEILKTLKSKHFKNGGKYKCHEPRPTRVISIYGGHAILLQAKPLE